MREMKKQKNLSTLIPLLQHAQQGNYAVGSFSPRYVAMIRPVLRGAQKENSPVIVQISQKELIRFAITPQEFAEEFFRCLHEEKITIPVALHLDHTMDFSVIKEAIASGFTSVMIDASQHLFEKNIELTREVVEYSHQRGVSVEGELGKIGSTNNVETDNVQELYTDPQEAKVFVDRTEVDALAVSVGTVHGVYLAKQPHIDFERLTMIRSLTAVPLVLHGGSGVPASMIQKAVSFCGGGITKVNIATDLELAFLEAIGRSESLGNQECWNLPSEVLAMGRLGVEHIVREKIAKFLGSSNNNWLGKGDSDGEWAI